MKLNEMATEYRDVHCVFMGKKKKERKKSKWNVGVCEFTSKVHF